MTSASENREFLTSRHFDAQPDRVLAAFSDPLRLARWWGPDGFTNTFHRFSFQPGEEWIHDMHGPDGTIYPNRSIFEETGPATIRIRHLETVHPFILTITLAPENDGTILIWRQTFDTVNEYERVKPYVPRCNEENLDRLGTELAREPIIE